jgi:WD40 repeat protein
MWCTRGGSSRYLSPIGLASLSVAFSPNGRYVAAGNEDGHLRIWDARTCHLLKRWEGHAPSIRPVAFRPDGKSLASGGGPPDYAWRCWNVSSLLQGRLLSSEHMVNDEVEKEVFTCKGHTVRFFPSCHIPLIALSTYLRAPTYIPCLFHMTGDGSSPRRAIVLHASGKQQLAPGSVR